MIRKTLRYFLATVTVAATVFGGIFATRNDFGLGRNIEIMVNLMRALSVSYVDEIQPDEMMRHGAAGITTYLDPYTSYISEEEMSDFETMTTGRYVGIGAMIRKSGDYVVIAEPYKGSPADRAGLMIGDRILEIDGESAKGLTTSEVSGRLRGEPNTTVKVKIEKLLGGEANMKIRRERIVIPSISYYGYVAEGVGYIRHDDFTDTCYDDMRSAINALRSQGELKSLILDYRNNGGGVLQSAVKILSLFVPKGTPVVELRGRSSERNEVYKTEYEPIAADLPLVVLINGNSASAAEIVSGAIQDLDRGVLVGQRSFGKGLVQSTIPVGFNSFVKLTTAKYYIPSGRCIQAMRYSADGRAEIMPDSLIGEFQTAGGRKVYDGGGIMPDIRTVPQYVSNFAVSLYLEGFIDKFGDDYVRRHPELAIDAATFTLPDDEYDLFKKMIEPSKVEYVSDSRRALNHLRTTLEKERYGESMGDALKQIEESLRDDKMSNLETYRNEIVSAINSNIALRAAYKEGAIANGLPSDDDVKRALEVLSDLEEYNLIRTTRSTERK